MTFLVELPPETEQLLRAQMPDLAARAAQAMLVEFYRQEKLTRSQLAQALGLNRMETDGLLKRHHVTEDLPTSEELADDFRQALLLVKR